MWQHAKLCNANRGRPPAHGNPRREAPGPAATTRRDCASKRSSGRERKPRVHRETAHTPQELGQPRRVPRGARGRQTARREGTPTAHHNYPTNRASRKVWRPQRAARCARASANHSRRAHARPLSSTRNAGHPRPTKAAAKAAALVHTNAAAANVLVLAATAALSVANKQASDLATMQLQQTQAQRQEQFCQSIQQHHQMRRARSSCINQQSNS